MACLPGRPAASAQLPTGTGRRTPDNKSFSMRLPLACNLDRSRSHYQAALEHARLQQFCAARAEFETSIQSCPYFVRAWVSWAQVSLVAQRSRNNSTTRSDRGLWEVESGPCATLPADGEASEQVAAAGALRGLPGSAAARHGGQPAERAADAGKPGPVPLALVPPELWRAVVSGCLPGRRA